MIMFNEIYIGIVFLVISVIALILFILNRNKVEKWAFFLEIVISGFIILGVSIFLLCLCFFIK